MLYDAEPTPTVLAIDDSAETLQIVRYALQRGGFEVLTAASGEEALDVLSLRGLPHLVVCDLRMPGMDGFDVCRALYRWSDLPVIMLTAVDEAETIVEGLQQHAEDYVVKPFAPEELVARARRVLQRIGVFPFPTETPLVVDDFLQIDFPNRTACLHDEEIALTPTETKLLYLLLRRPGETLLYDYLLRRMWPRELVFEDRLHVFVHRLRNKLSSGFPHHRYIVLDRGEGYRFEPVTVAEPA